MLGLKVRGLARSATFWLGGLVAVISFGLAAVAIPARATYGAKTTADEPQYLITALSLAHDLDLDISNQIDDREFEPFHELTLNQQTIPLDSSGRRISPHDPLLPVLLAPSMGIGGYVAAKGVLAALSAATAVLTFWVAVRRFEVSPLRAAIVTCVFWAGVPLAPYGTQVYPEIPAALCVILAVLALTEFSGVQAPSRHNSQGPVLVSGSQGRAARVGPPDLARWAVLLVWVTVSALPWLAVKYAPVAAIIAALLACRLFRAGSKRPAAAAVGAWVIAGLAYLVLHQKIYGGWTVYAAGDHFVDSGEFAVVGNDPDYFGRSRRLVGLLVDRRFGIATWHPAWLLAPFAMVWASVTDRMYRIIAVPIFMGGLLTATFVALTMHGWWFPGRQMVVVLPVVVLAVAKLEEAFQKILYLVLAAGLAGVVNWVWLVWEASNGKRTLVVDHWEVGAWPYRALSVLMPDGLASGSGPVIGLAIWGFVLVGSMLGAAVLAGARLVPLSVSRRRGSERQEQ